MTDASVPTETDRYFQKWRQRALLLRDCTKWLLEFARNLLVLGALFFLAAKSENLYIGLFTAVCTLALTMYVMSYLFAVDWKLFRRREETALSVLLDLLVAGIVFAAIAYWGSKVVIAVATEIAKVQMR